MAIMDNTITSPMRLGLTALGLFAEISHATLSLDECTEKALEYATFPTVNSTQMVCGTSLQLVATSAANATDPSDIDKRTVCPVSTVRQTQIVELACGGTYARPIMTACIVG